MTGRGQAWHELRHAGGRRCTLSAHEPASAVDQQDLGEAGADVHDPVQRDRARPH